MSAPAQLDLFGTTSEQAIAKGTPTSRIMAALGVSYADVQNARATIAAAL